MAETGTPPTPKTRKASATKSGTGKAAPKSTTKSAATAKAKTTASTVKKAAARTAGVAASAAGAAATAAGKTISESVDWRAQADQIKNQAADMARSAAATAKDSTGSAMQNLARLINETADTVDSKLGPAYGDYTRSAASAVANAAKSLDDADIDQLLDEARAFVKKSPAVAIGAAAVAGFVLMRLAKGGGSD